MRKEKARKEENPSLIQGKTASLRKLTPKPIMGEAPLTSQGPDGLQTRYQGKKP